jgi:type IV fimbrial biogenesis protein FimT
VLKPSRHGFTLTELMVVLAIMAVLMTAAAPSFKDWLANSQIRTKGEAVLNGMQLARTEALKRNTAIFFSLAADSSWSVGCVNPTADNDDDGVADCPAIIQRKTAAEGGNAVSLAITPATSSQAIFNGIGVLKTPNPDGTMPINRIDFDSSALPSGQARALRVVLTDGGLARLCDPHITTAGDPRKC